MKTKQKTLTIAILLALLAPMLAATAYEYELTPEQERELSNESREEYKQALEELDHLNYPSAIRHFETIRTNEEDNSAIRLLLGRLYIDRARVSHGEQAHQHLQNALFVYEELKSMAGEDEKELLEKAENGIERTRGEMNKELRLSKLRQDVREDYFKQVQAEYEARERAQRLRMARQSGGSSASYQPRGGRLTRGGTSLGNRGGVSSGRTSTANSSGVRSIPKRGNSNNVHSSDINYRR